MFALVRASKWYIALFEGLALLFFVDPEATRWTDQAETSMRMLIFGLQQSLSS